MIRGINLRGAIAVNVITMIGIGPLITIPLVLAKLHGSLALAGWIIGALIASATGWCGPNWAPVTSAPAGTYVYLREALGPQQLGTALRLPVRLAEHLLVAAHAGFRVYRICAVCCVVLPGARFRHACSKGSSRRPWRSRPCCCLYRRIESVARLSMIMASISCATLLAIILAGLPHVTPHVFLPPAGEAVWPALLAGIGPALILTTYDYYGYGQACMVGDEVTRAEADAAGFGLLVGRDRLRALLVAAGFRAERRPVAKPVALESGRRAARRRELRRLGDRDANLGPAAAAVVTIAVLMTAFASTFGNLLGAARLPYAAALDKLFFSPFARLHPTGRFPHVSLLVMGLMAVPFCFLSLGDVIAFLVTAALLTQNVAQIGALVRDAGEGRTCTVPDVALPAARGRSRWLAGCISSSRPAVKRSHSASLTLAAG